MLWISEVAPPRASRADFPSRHQDVSSVSLLRAWAAGLAGALAMIRQPVYPTKGRSPSLAPGNRGAIAANTRARTRNCVYERLRIPQAAGAQTSITNAKANTGMKTQVSAAPQPQDARDFAPP